MRVLLAELAPARGDVDANLARVRTTLEHAPADLGLFPELYLSGYRVGDRILRLALEPTDPRLAELVRVVERWGHTVVVGTPWVSPERSGEVWNAALVIRPDGTFEPRVKRFLPNYGPFEEGVFFTPAPSSAPVAAFGHRLGIEICYDAFFPEVTRELALKGADFLINISASPVTSRSLFEKLLPARAVENACPMAYVNRVGVEDGVVFGGGSVVLDARGEPLPLETVEVPGLSRDERVVTAEVDVKESHRWRPFRPVLRDVAVRPPATGSLGPA